jgi:ribonuclease Z
MTFALTVLGSGSALPVPARFSTAHLLNVDEHFFLIDCGEGTQIQLRRFTIKLGKINHIFISHYHGDHLFGLFGLISTFTLLGRKPPLHIYCHPEITGMVKHQVGYFSEHPGFELVFHTLRFDEPSFILDEKKVSVWSFPLKHKVETCGFIFKEKQRLQNMRKDALEKYNIPVKQIPLLKSGADFTLEDGTVIPNREITYPPPKPRMYAYCSDTKYDEAIIPLIRGADLLYHEATFGSDMDEQAEKTGHSTARQAALIAKAAGVKQLLIGHFSIRYKTIDFLLKEARDIFPDTVAAEDGLKISVPLVR